MKTAIEDYENKSGDKLHGVVVVPFFTTIFKEEAKSLAVPNITIKLPNGQTLATSATKGVATGAKSTVSIYRKGNSNCDSKNQGNCRCLRCYNTCRHISSRHKHSCRL